MINELNQIKAALRAMQIENIWLARQVKGFANPGGSVKKACEGIDKALTLIDWLIAVEVNKTENMTDKSVRGV